MTATSPRLFLVDGYALIYRSFFALGEQKLLNSRGENTAIARGMLDFLQRLIDRHKPEYIGWVHDAGLSFRHEQYPDYKATRERLEPEQQVDFDAGVERVKEILDAFHVPVLELEGYEADDVIGTLTAQAPAAGVEAVVVSGDKDFMQLIGPGVRILNPWHGRPGRTAEHWYGEANATERLGVKPEFVVDYLALLGDTSDNVPGVKGIGEKTARALIEQWGSLESILAHLSEVTPTRAQNALREHAADGTLSKSLVTIRRDLPMSLDLPLLERRDPNWAKLRDLMVALEFRAHAQAAAARAGESAEESAAPAAKTSYAVIDTVDALTALVKEATAAGSIGFDTETVLDAGAPPVVNPLRSRIVGMSIATGAGVAYYLPLRHRVRRAEQEGLGLGEAPAKTVDGPKNLPDINHPAMAPLRDLLASATVRKTGHNLKYDLHVLRREGVVVNGVDFDSMLASYLLDPGRRSHAIDGLSIEILQRPMQLYEDVTGKGKQQVGFDEVPVESARDYAAADADVALQLRGILEPKLAATGADRLLRDVELPLMRVLMEMEATGIRIDLSWFHSLKTRFAREREAAERAIHDAAGEVFNVNSSKQLAAILFERMGLPVKKKTATGPSTDASVLQQLADEGHQLPRLILEYRELAKLESTYLDTLPALVNPETGRLHTSYQQAVAATGRLASTDPNLQNIPIRRELGRAIRQGFIARPGWILMAADYSQVELRLLAHLSGDTAFVEAFRSGGDIHRQTASIIFGVPLDGVTSEMRARAKTINFATIYGQGAHALSQQLKIEHAEAREFIDTYFKRFAGVRQFLDKAVETAKARGYAETILGRRRYIPELTDRNFNIRAFGERTAQNSPIQGSAADLIKVAMIKIQHELDERRLECRMLLQVHDELVFELPPKELEAVTEMVTRLMTTAVPLSVPLIVDIGTGGNWLEAKA